MFYVSLTRDTAVLYVFLTRDTAVLYVSLNRDVAVLYIASRQSGRLRVRLFLRFVYRRWEQSHKDSGYGKTVENI